MVSGRRHNLPAQPTSLLARGDDVAAVTRQLLRGDVRLLTLTGPGGVGKTRLAIAVAETLLGAFPDGVWLVDLTPLHDATLVSSAIAEMLGVHQVTDLPLLDSLCDHLRDRRALLVLDNLEHVLEGTTDLAKLLESCPDLKLLLTSRVALRSRWEHLFAVAPLDVPPAGASAAFDDVASAGAVALFVQRAQAASPEFVLCAENAAAVAELCARLDGLPLAIELAAARSPVLTPAQMLTRMPERLDLLAGGAPEQPSRHRTLRDAIAWSYDLLASFEQSLFRRLGVFAGGWTLDAVDSTLAPQPSPLDALASLVGANLVRRDGSPGGAHRFRMLETIRAYALERLEAAGELVDARRHHADYYLALAENLGSRLNGPEQISALDRLQVEHDNLRAALRWALDVGAVEHGLRLAGAIGWFWWVRGHLSEGRAWLARLLALPGAEVQTLIRAGALDAAGFLAFQQGAFAEAVTLHGEALAIREAFGDRSGMRESLHGLGDAYMFLHDSGQATALFERGIANAAELDDIWGQALFSFHLGLLTAIQHGPAATRTLYERALALSRETGNAWGIAYSGGGLGRAALAVGDVDAADTLFRETLGRLCDVGDQFSIPIRLSDLAAIAAARSNWERVLRLEGASAALREARGYARHFVAPAEVDARIATARQKLPPAIQAAAWADGFAMSLDEAVAYALAPADLPTSPAASSIAASSLLTPREHEVAVLIGHGLTNRQIGEALVITEGTARVHVAHVLAKLGFHSRVQVAAWAAERGLLDVPRPDA